MEAKSGRDRNINPRRGHDELDGSGAARAMRIRYQTHDRLTTADPHPPTPPSDGFILWLIHRNGCRSDLTRVADEVPSEAIPKERPPLTV